MKISRIIPITFLVVATLSFSACNDAEKKAEEEKVRMEAEQAETQARADEKAEKERVRVAEENAANSIASKAMNTENLTTLTAALRASGLNRMLMETGDYTVFAPTDEAFSKLPGTTLEDLLKPENKERLISVLQYHVVPEIITSAQLVDAIKNNNGKYTLSTAAGRELIAMMEKDNVIIQDGRGKKAKVIQANIEASNGVIHLIDAVLLAKK